jgi:hypothetical protein
MPDGSLSPVTLNTASQPSIEALEDELTEKVRVARALPGLPKLADAMRRGAGC